MSKIHGFFDSCASGVLDDFFIPEVFKFLLEVVVFHVCVVVF